MPEWQVDIAYASEGRFAKFAKKHAREYDSLFANLEKILCILRSGSKIGGFQVGFFRSEGGGVYRIGQTSVRSAKESRLYVYFDEQKHVVYTLNVGTKDGQTEDINDAKATVHRIKISEKG